MQGPKLCILTALLFVALAVLAWVLAWVKTPWNAARYAPIYVFGAVVVTGLFLVLQQRELWILLVVLLVAQTIRAKKEARVLEAAFGEEYREYRRKTWF